MRSVLVLGGGPDAERPVSLASSRAVAEALGGGGAFDVEYRVIDRIDGSALAALPGDVVFPVLHGAFGEGGPLQDLLEADGRPYVGSEPGPARLAMDKMATKLVAAGLGMRTPEAAIVNPADDACPQGLPVIVKPIHEGSSVGLCVCRDESDWARAVAAGSDRPMMVERFIGGRELTVGLLDGSPLPTIQIIPAHGLYDYDAKYDRDDTRYVVGPDLDAGVERAMQRDAVRLARALGVRHLARVDFILDEQGMFHLLEVNTMPGFTAHSLVPKATAKTGIDMPELCARLVSMAVRDAPRRTDDPGAGAGTRNPAHAAVRAGAAGSVGGA